MKSDYKVAYSLVRQYYSGKLCASTREKIGKVLLLTFSPRILRAVRATYFGK